MLHHKVPGPVLKICLLGIAFAALIAIALSVFMTSAPPAPAAPARAQQHSTGACQTQIATRVPHTLSVVTPDGCDSFVLTVTSQTFPTKITVCPQRKTPPVLLDDDYQYETKICRSWIAKENVPHKVFPSSEDLTYPGYVIQFEGTEGHEGYSIEAVIQQ